MSAEGPPRGANCAPSGGSAAAKRQAWGVHTNFDGLPGPTHNYAGLAQGNLAAARNAKEVANPREAALQGLAKMRALATRGYPQAVLPPQERPDVAALRALGFDGDDHDVIARAGREAPAILAASSSAAAMWVANAATVSASADCRDGRVHFTPANLVTHFHRAIEAPTTTLILRAIFADETRFCVHDPLPSVPQFGESHALHERRGRTRGRVVRVRPNGILAGTAPGALSRAADPRGERSRRASAWSRRGARALHAAESAGDRCRRVSQRRDCSGRRHAPLLSRTRVPR
jgi:hypothetical protein